MAAMPISQCDQQRVNQAVQAAEANTAAEIVPVLAEASGRYDRAEDVAGLWLAMLAVAAVWIIYPPPQRPAAGDWAGWPPWGQLAAIVAAAIVAFLVGAIVAARVNWLRRLFTPRVQMRDEVAARARAVFFDNRVHHTADATGLLIYVSLFERTAAVLADRAVVEKLGEPALHELRDALTASLRRHTPADAICATIEAAAAKLADALPRQSNDVNELPDALILLLA